MTLADMIRLDEDALICDLAETYHIFDYRSLPLKLVATLSVGLRDDSRIKMKKANVSVSTETFLLGLIADEIEIFRRGFSSEKDKPKLITDAFIEKPKSPTFTTGEELEKALAKIRGE